jgi:hypothetical protein
LLNPVTLTHSSQCTCCTHVILAVQHHFPLGLNIKKMHALRFKGACLRVSSEGGGVFLSDGTAAFMGRKACVRDLARSTGRPSWAASAGTGLPSTGNASPMGRLPCSSERDTWRFMEAAQLSAAGLLLLETFACLGPC